MGITVKELEYSNVESKGDTGKDMLFDILTQCTCVQEGKGEFIIDVEMQRKKRKEYLVRTNMYGARLLDANSQCNLSYQDQVKNIVISIIDDELDEMQNLCVFAVRPFVQNIFSYGETKWGNSGPLEDPCTIQIYIQLPAICRAIKAFHRKEIEGNFWLENEWLSLLGSRRLCVGEKVAYVENGVYDINQQTYTDEKVKNAIDVLKKLNGNIQEYKLSIEAYNRRLLEYQAEEKEREELNAKLDQSRKDLEQSRKEIAQKDEMITRMEQVNKLRKQVKSFRKEQKKQKPRKSNLPERLRKLDKDAIKQYVKDTDDSISELSEFLDQMQED